MYERPHLQQLVTRIQESKQFIEVVIGPRQVGKTTMITQLLKKNLFSFHMASADAVPVSNRTWLEQHWETARLMMDQQEVKEFLLVIDEIQKIDNWSETVKLLWDSDKNKGRQLKVILLGSSRLLLQQGLTESLAGRFEQQYVGHWSLKEMETAFGWTPEQFAWFGGYPGSAPLIEDEKRWKNYVRESLIETSISKDILMLTRVDKPALMRQLFELGCLYSGQELSFTKMLGQLQDAGNTTTLSHYLNLLNTAGLLTGLSKYSSNKLSNRSSSPKFQVHNTAMIAAQQQYSFEEARANAVLWGRIVENAVGAHLLNYSISEDYELFYWREGGAEVDFVIKGEGKLVGIEVKSSKASATKGMTIFKKQLTPDKLLLIGEGGLPWQDLLRIDPWSLLKK
jgi:predicted AAA+ superfamily ATPase